MYRFEKLSTEQDIISIDLDNFAKSFQHDVSRLFPIWTAYDSKDNLVSYCHLHKHVVAYPAIKPGISPRSCYRLGWEWLTKLKIDYGDPLMVLPEAFSNELVSKVGLEPFRTFKVRE